MRVEIDEFIGRLSEAQWNQLWEKALGRVVGMATRAPRLPPGPNRVADRRVQLAANAAWLDADPRPTEPADLLWVGIMLGVVLAESGAWPVPEEQGGVT